MTNADALLVGSIVLSMLGLVLAIYLLIPASVASTGVALWMLIASERRR